MRNKIKEFLTKKRCKRKKLLNNRGFSLLEVLVAVSIIGIITAIAVPQFTAQQDKAARVAGDTSASNIQRAFSNCMVLNSFSECQSLGSIGISSSQCPGCKVTVSGTKFCAEVVKDGKAAGSEIEKSGKFSACVSIDTSTSPYDVTRSYGGTLLSSASRKVCYTKKTASGTCTTNTESAVSPLFYCSAPADCTSITEVTATGNTCGVSRVCKQGGTGRCKTDATCG